jgi:hypothetical protein
MIGTHGRPLNVPLSGGDRTSPPANPRPDAALNNGNGKTWQVLPAPAITH